MLLAAAAKLGVLPVVGVRAKLATRHGGHWGSTSGEHAKFGLRPAEIMAVVRQLAAGGMLDRLQLLHFHIGSQARTCSINCTAPIYLSYDSLRYVQHGPQFHLYMQVQLYLYLLLLMTIAFFTRLSK